MDGAAPDANLLSLLITSGTDLLEPALAARPGWVDIAVEIDLPDAPARERLLTLHDQNVPPDLTRTGRAPGRRATDGTNASFLRELIRRSVLEALHDDPRLSHGHRGAPGPCARTRSRGDPHPAQGGRRPGYPPGRRRAATGPRRGGWVAYDPGPCHGASPNTTAEPPAPAAVCESWPPGPSPWPVRHNDLALARREERQRRALRSVPAMPSGGMITAEPDGSCHSGRLAAQV